MAARQGRKKPPREQINIENIETKGEPVQVSSELPDFLNELYRVDLLSEEELLDYYEAFKYVGFDRDEMLEQLKNITRDPKIAVQLIILCAMRGPQAAAIIPLKNGKTPVEMKIPASGAQGKHFLTCQRITAATADLAAFYLKKLNIPKRLPSFECPGWLQFPSAGSIKLPENLRQQHIEFSRAFSKVIGGVFNESIYATMMSNAYLEPRLHLFD